MFSVLFLESGPCGINFFLCYSVSVLFNACLHILYIVLELIGLGSY